MIWGEPVHFAVDDTGAQVHFAEDQAVSTGTLCGV